MELSSNMELSSIMPWNYLLSQSGAGSKAAVFCCAAGVACGSAGVFICGCGWCHLWRMIP
jgi:hypothetical protein